MGESNVVVVVKALQLLILIMMSKVPTVSTDSFWIIHMLLIHNIIAISNIHTTATLAI